MTDSTVFYGPAGAPVFGRYDSYGRLDDAESPYGDGELVADEEVFEGRGMFFHARALEAITERIAGDLVVGRRRHLVLEHWDAFAHFMATHPGNPIHEMYSQRQMHRGGIGDLIEVLQRSTAWDPDDYTKLREMSRDQVADMVAVVDAAGLMGRVIGPSGYITEGDETVQVELTHQVAGELLALHQARQDGVV